MPIKDFSVHADAKHFLDERGYSGHLIRGQAPYLLFEEAVRNRITDSYYWKEQCFGLNAASLCDRAADLAFIGGTFNDGRRPTPFLCLAFKMLQLNVEREIVYEYLEGEGAEFKYLRALAAFYIRLTAEDSVEVYKRLEPLLEDKRKLRRRANAGYRLTYVDEFVDELLTKERSCATSFWKLVPRQQLEDEDKLQERVSPLQGMLDAEDDEDAAEDERENGENSEDMADGSADADADADADTEDEARPNGYRRRRRSRSGSSQSRSMSDRD